MTKPILLIPFAAPQKELSYLLEDAPETCAFGRSLSGLPKDEFEAVCPIILAHDDRCLGIAAKIRAALEAGGWGEQTEMLPLEAPTHSQAETIACALKTLQIDGSFWTKDPDNFFHCEMQDGNVVTAFPLDGLTRVNPQDKSYLSISDDDFVMNIAEKRIVGRYFCTGGYGFEAADEFLSAYEELRELGQLYLSHVIYQMMLSGKHFRPIYVSDYRDWGTKEEWSSVSKNIRFYKRTFVCE